MTGLDVTGLDVTGLDEAGLTEEQDARFWDYVTHAAQFMVNSME